MTLRTTNNHIGQETETRRRILAVRHGKISIAITAHLKKLIPSDSYSLLSVGLQDSDFNLSSLLDIPKSKDQVRHYSEFDQFSGAGSALFSRERFEENLFAGIDSLQRIPEEIENGWGLSIGFHDCHHYYHIVVDVLARILSQNRINLVLFFELPSNFYDTILYQIAQSSNVKCLILTQSIFPNKFFSLNSIEEFGNLPPIPEEFAHLSDTVYEPAASGHNSQGNKDQNRRKQSEIATRTSFNLFLYLLTHNPSQLSRFSNISKTVKRMRTLALSFPSWNNPFSSLFHINHLSKFESLFEFEITHYVDLGRNFVFFPLESQSAPPAQEQMYSDQLLAVERLTTILPKDCLVYLKEHSIQTGQARGSVFFQRLRRIPNVRYIPSSAINSELTSQAAFLATVAGNAGWDAIYNGKNVLVFGKPWYRKFPGVVEFNEGVRYEDVSKFEFDRSDVDAHLSWLESRSHTGIVSRLSANKVENETENQNVESVTKIIFELIEGKANTTFS